MIKEETARAQPAPAGKHVRVEAARKQWIYRDALKPVAELDGSGALVSEFVYGAKSNVPDYVRRGGATYRVVSDQLGSPRYVVNVANSADVPFTASYTSFGEVTGTGLDWMPVGFAGGIYDAETGLIRFGARDYDGAVGRWLSKDPTRFAGGASLYAYAANDPPNTVDVDGQNPILIVVFAAAILLSDSSCSPKAPKCDGLRKAQQERDKKCPDIPRSQYDGGSPLLLQPGESAPDDDQMKRIRECQELDKKVGVEHAKCTAELL